MSLSFTLRKTVPWRGSGDPAEIWALAKATPKPAATPITSPVDFISGPRIVSTPRNLLNGKTGDFTKQWCTFRSSVRPRSRSFSPTINLAATLARGTPVDLLTYGTVRDALGFTSSTYTAPSFVAN